MPALLVGFGCAPKERELVGNGFRYMVRSDDVVEPEILNTLGAHRSAIAAFLRLDDNAIGELKYHKFRDSTDLHRRGHCSDASSACYFRKWGVEASTPFERHELVHAYVAHWGDSHRLLEEGLADSLSCPRHLPQKVDIGVEEAFSQEAWSSLDRGRVGRLYAAGAWFVAHLVRTYGPERFQTFYSRTLAEHELPEVRAIFAQVFSVEIEQAWQHASAVESVDAPCLRAHECSLSAPAADSAHAGAYATTVEAGELLHFATRVGEAWRLGACDGSVLPYESERLRSTGEVRGEEHWLSLAPGKYWLELRASSLNRVPLARHVVDAGACGSAVPVDVGEQRDVFFAVATEGLAARAAAPLVNSDAVRNAGGTDEPLIANANALALVLHLRSSASLPATLECSDTAQVELCTGCDYMQCQVACTAGRATPVIISEGAVLKVTPLVEANLWFRLRKGNR